MSDYDERGGDDGTPRQAPEQKATAFPKIAIALLLLVIAAVVIGMLIVHPSGGADNAALGPR